jgi:hypothetical protein
VYAKAAPQAPPHAAPPRACQHCAGRLGRAAEVAHSRLSLFCRHAIQPRESLDGELEGGVTALIQVRVGLLFQLR